MFWSRVWANSYAESPNIKRATILGDGKVVPILNINDLLSVPSGKLSTLVMKKTIDIKKKEAKKSILIVEDSFLSRTLLKNILDASGYMVTTAIHGEDGYYHAKLGDF